MAWSYKERTMKEFVVADLLLFRRAGIHCSPTTPSDLGRSQHRTTSPSGCHYYLVELHSCIPPKHHDRATIHLDSTCHVAISVVVAITILRNNFANSNIASVMACLSVACTCRPQTSLRQWIPSAATAVPSSKHGVSWDASCLVSQSGSLGWAKHRGMADIDRL